jgi:transformation/transcription domain-associated protein
MMRTMDGSSDLWRMRKQFASQVASLSFMTYVLCLSSRNPGRFYISRATGLVAMTELLPGEHTLEYMEYVVFKVDD